MIGRLPRTLEVEGTDYEIRTDFRDVLTIMEAFGDPELADEEKYIVMLTILYQDTIPAETVPEAIDRAIWFLDCGQEDDSQKPSCKVMDWEQDEAILFPAINKVAGQEVRAVEYMHWWTFMGYFMEIDEGTFSTILGIRQKRAKGRRLEKWEQEFYRENRELCDLKKRYTAEEQTEIDKWNELLG